MSEFYHNGVTFHYEVYGEGRPLIFLHGLGGSVEQPKGLLEPIAGTQYIYLDLRAHGKTDIITFQNLDFNILADDVAALADELKLTKFCVGGISMGAGVSVNLAVRYSKRIEKLILIRNAWLAEPMEMRIRNWYEVLYQYLKKRDKEAFLLTKEFSEIKQMTIDTANTFMQLFEDEASLKYPEKFEVMPNKQPLQEMKELEKIQIETLILSNQEDPIHSFEYGEEYRKRIVNAASFEITPKVISKERHKNDINGYLKAFIEG